MPELQQGFDMQMLQQWQQMMMMQQQQQSLLQPQMQQFGAPDPLPMQQKPMDPLQQQMFFQESQQGVQQMPSQQPELPVMPPTQGNSCAPLAPLPQDGPPVQNVPEAQEPERKRDSSRKRSGSRRRSRSRDRRRRRSRSGSRRRDRSGSRRRRRNRSDSSSSRRSRRRNRSRRRSPSRRRGEDRRGDDRFGGGKAGKAGYGGGGSFGGGKGGYGGGGSSMPLGGGMSSADLGLPALQAPGQPSMAELTANPTAGGSNSTLQEHEIKVIDPRGQQLTNFQRFATFDEAPFAQSLKADLARAGFPAPSQIQQYTWPLATQGIDTIGVAATGSGKTCGFLLPAFDWILKNQVQAGQPVLLVMAPTRELAVQIEEEAVKFGRNSGIRTTCCYGGAPKGPQAADIRAGVHGVIGTPGRINDFLEAGQLQLGNVRKLVLDEADRMLDMGFEPQIRKILQQVPRTKHTLFFTATWPASVRRLASEFLNQPFQVQIGNRDELKGNQDITQIVKPCTNFNKNQILMGVLQQSGVADRSNRMAKAIIFCSTKKMCDQLQQQLNRSGINCAAIHGDKGQREREAALNQLKTGEMKLICATDVAARGIDIKGVTLVVNYDAPGGTEDYVHRIGRTGRAGQKGYAVTLICDRDAHALRGIMEVMRRTNQEITPEVEMMARNAGPPPPSGRALRGKGKGK